MIDLLLNMQKKLNLYPTMAIIGGTELAAYSKHANMPDAPSLLSWRVHFEMVPNYI